MLNISQWVGSRLQDQALPPKESGSFEWEVSPVPVMAPCHGRKKSIGEIVGQNIYG